MTLVKSIWYLMILIIVGATVALSMWGIPAPTIPVEKVIPNDKLPQ